MKFQRLFCLSFAVAWLLGTSTPSAVAANTTPDATPLPLPTSDQQTTQLPLLIEQDSNAVVLDEKQRPIGQVKSLKNVAAQQMIGTSDMKATVLALADEEFRKAHPKDWKKRIGDAIEKADNAFQQKHHIDLQIKVYGEWSSQGSDDVRLLEDLDRDWNKGQYDFIIGFTNDSHFADGGIAYQYPEKPEKSAVSVVKDMDPKYMPYAVQHEFSHNYNIGHDPQGSGIHCIMNYDYAYETTEWDSEHNKLLEKNRAWYGS